SDSPNLPAHKKTRLRQAGRRGSLFCLRFLSVPQYLSSYLPNRLRRVLRPIRSQPGSKHRRSRNPHSARSPLYVTIDGRGCPVGWTTRSCGCYGSLGLRTRPLLLSIGLDAQAIRRIPIFLARFPPPFLLRPDRYRPSDVPFPHISWVR